MAKATDQSPSLPGYIGTAPPVPRATRASVHSDADLKAANDLLASSWETGQAHAFQVDEATANKLKSLFRTVAEAAGSGLSLRDIDGTLYVQAIAKRNRTDNGKPRKPRETDKTRGTADFEAKMRAYELAIAEWENS